VKVTYRGPLGEFVLRGKVVRVTDTVEVSADHLGQLRQQGFVFEDAKEVAQETADTDNVAAPKD
jgi:hypothetical protein